MRKYLNMIVKTWQQLTSTGAHSDLEAPLRKRIIITNKVCLTLIALAVVFFFFWLSHGGIQAALVNAMTAFIFILPFWLNSKKYYTASRLLLLVIFNLAMLVLAASFTAGEMRNSVQITFYIMAGLGFILFGANEKLSLLISVLMPVVLFQFLIFYDFNFFETPLVSAMGVDPTMNYNGNFVFIILCMFYLSQESDRAEKELSATNKRLQNSQIFLKSIIENLPLAFYTRDMENRYTLVNSEFEKLFSVDKNEVLLKTDSEIFSKSKVEFLVLFDNEVFKNQSSKIFEASIGPEGDKEQKTFLCTKFPILGPQRETFGICGLALDISDRIAAQKQLDEQRALVIDNVRLTALTDMANGMSHEINNPLAILEIIYGKLSRILTGSNYSAESLRDSLVMMQSAIKRIGFIVGALRKFIEKPKDKKKESVDLINLINEIMALNNEKIKQAGIKLIVNTSGVPFNVVCQPGEIRQVLHSLVSNSFDVLANISNGTIKISTYYLDNSVKIVVQDSGPGIPKDLVRKLFQPFFTTKDVGEGQGLSLSVARGIINSHGGKLYYDTSSELTTFVIELPRS